MSLCWRENEEKMVSLYKCHFEEASLPLPSNHNTSHLSLSAETESEKFTELAPSSFFE